MESLGRTWSGVVAALMLAGCAQEPLPDLVLVSVDTLRADVFLEVARSEPALQRLVQGGVVFEAATSPAPLTLPAHASLLSGLSPDRTGVRHNGQTVRFEHPPLPERLADAGYATAAVVSAYPLDRRFGLARGFEHYDQPEPGPEARSRFQTLERDANASVERALDWWRGASGPRFLWVHLFDPHSPYAAPGVDPASPLRARYAAEVAHAGRALGRLLDELERGGRPFVLVLVSDHGEGLGDHDELDHGLLLYDSTLLVPMVWYGSPSRWESRRVAQTPALIDVAPTMLAIADLPADASMEGLNLIPLLRGEPMVLPDAYAETWYPDLAYGRQPLRALRGSERKLIATDADAELYSPRIDPTESDDLAAREPARVDAMRFDLSLRRPADPGAGPDPAALRQLRSLGYLAAPPSSRLQGGHPREVVASHRRLVALQHLLEAGDDDAALDAARSLRIDEPDNAFAASVLAALLLDRGDIEAGVVELEAALALDPENAQNRFSLAEVLMRKGRFDAALPHWQVLETLEPERPAVWINEAAALAHLGLWSEAAVAIRQALALAPDDPVALENAGKIFEALRDWYALAAVMDQVAALNSGRPVSAKHGMAWLRAGDVVRAEHWFGRVPQDAVDQAVVVLGRVIIARRTGRSREVEALEATLEREHPRLWQSALREFPELSRHAVDAS